MKQVQISAYIAESTRDELDSLTRARGLKKSAVIEQALLMHLRALQELPEDMLLPPRLVLGPRSAAVVLESLGRPAASTPALDELFRDEA
jgi:hypothetical protein